MISFDVSFLAVLLVTSVIAIAILINNRAKIHNQPLIPYRAAAFGRTEIISQSGMDPEMTNITNITVPADISTYKSPVIIYHPNL